MRNNIMVLNDMDGTDLIRVTKAVPAIELVNQYVESESLFELENVDLSRIILNEEQWEHDCKNVKFDGSSFDHVLFSDETTMYNVSMKNLVELDGVIFQNCFVANGYVTSSAVNGSIDFKWSDVVHTQFSLGMGLNLVDQTGTNFDGCQFSLMTLYESQRTTETVEKFPKFSETDFIGCEFRFERSEDDTLNVYDDQTVFELCTFSNCSMDRDFLQNIYLDNCVFNGIEVVGD